MKVNKSETRLTRHETLSATKGSPQPRMCNRLRLNYDAKR